MQIIKELRVIGFLSLAFLAYEMDKMMSWVMTSNPESLGEGLAITGIFGSIAAMFRFVFQYTSFANINKPEGE